MRGGLTQLSGDIIAIGGSLPRHSRKWTVGFHAGVVQKRHLSIPEMQTGLEGHLRPHGIDAGNLMTLGIPDADVTNRTVTPMGSLLPEFIPDREGDFIHGNLAWGAEVAREIIPIPRL